MNIAFSMTIQQFKARTKTVTRRAGNSWRRLKSGKVLNGIEKGQGLKQGEHVVPLGPIRVLDVRLEPLRRMTDDPEYGRQECIKEGFPDLTPEQFVAMFCQSHRIVETDPNMQGFRITRPYRPEDEVARIEYEYLDEVG